MSFRTQFSLFGLVAILAPFAAVANENAAPNLSTQVYDLVDARRFDDALGLLSDQSINAKASFEHRFLRARVLMWKGDYQTAETALNTLSQEFPDHADIELAHANLDFYQNRLDAAEAHFLKVLQLAPDYTDAQSGLQKVRDARQNTPAPFAPVAQNVQPWRADVSAGTTAVGDGQPSWNEQTVRLERRTGRFALHGKAQRLERFGLVDTELEVGVAQIDPSKLLWSATASATPKDDFRPQYTIGGSVGKVVDFGSTAVQFGVGYRFDDYSQTKIHAVTPEATAYLPNGVILVARAVSVSEADADHQLGWFAMGQVPVHDKIDVRIGGAIAPEAINGIVSQTQSYFAGVSYEFQPGVALTANYGRDARDVGFNRDSFRVGISRKF